MSRTIIQAPKAAVHAVLVIILRIVALVDARPAHTDCGIAATNEMALSAWIWANPVTISSHRPAATCYRFIKHAPRDLEGESAQQIPDALAADTADTPGRTDKSDAVTTLTKGF